MDELYLDTLGRIQNVDPQRLHNVLAVLFTVKEPVSDDVLAALADLSPEAVRTTLASFASLLIIQDDKIQVLHKSFADVITDNKRCTNSGLFVNKILEEPYLAKRCLEFLNGMVDNKSSGHEVDYAAAYWSLHLVSVAQTSPIELIDAVVSGLNNFATFHLIHYLEHLSKIKKISTAALSLELSIMWISRAFMLVGHGKDVCPSRYSHNPAYF